MSTRPARLQAALGSSLLLLAACAGNPSPLANAPAPRVVSLAPALTAIVHALGADAHLVGVTSFCDAPGKPVVGDLAPRPEAVLAQRPDLVLMAGYASQADTAAALGALGLRVDTLPLVTLADMRASTATLGRLLHREPAATAALAAFDQALSAAPRGRPVKTLIVYDLQPGFVTTTGGGDHIAELAALLGADNIARGPVTLRLGLERVLEAAPELILHVAPDQRFPDSAAALAHWSAWPSLPAVARRQVIVYPDDALARNGPHLAAVVPRLAALIDAARAAEPAP